MPGRGKSDWLDSKEDYNYLWAGQDKAPLFHNILVSLIARLCVDSVYWIGTSMGGLLGIELAAQKASPIRRLILNDIGPFVSGASRKANAALAEAAGEYQTEADAVKFVLESKKAFGPFTEEAAKKFALDAGLPIVPGSTGPIEEDTYKKAEDLGYPIIIKAASCLLYTSPSPRDS